MRVAWLLFFFTWKVAAFAASQTLEVVTAQWQKLLSDHVDSRGAVSYLGFAKDRAKLAAYLNAHRDLNLHTLSEKQKKAAYINLYNAFMISSILRYAQEKKISLTDKSFLALKINKIQVADGNIWNGSYKLKLAGQMVNLDDIEHNLVRGKATKGALTEIKVKQLDPRIHMAVNCAAISCPRLRNEAYRAATIDRMLDENIKEFVNAGKQLYRVDTTTKIKLNKIVLWYYEDFDTYGQRIMKNAGAGDYLASFMVSTSKDAKFITHHLQENLNDRSKLVLRFSRAFDFFYDWKINDKRNF